MDGADARFTIKKGLTSVVDHIRLMGIIARESFAHPSRATTIIYDQQTREIKVSTEPRTASPAGHR